ncbi:MAG: radical SAM protein [Treponema sp.]|nr:radical SAM protein [Treponema sp.]
MKTAGTKAAEAETAEVKAALPGKRTVCLVQPPFVQLSGPYPSVYYLRAFLEKRGYKVIVRDHSIGLFLRIFSRTGLERIFADIKKITGTGTPASGIGSGSGLSSGIGSGAAFPKNLLAIINRFLSEEKLWLACIDRLVLFLQGHDREWGHFLTLANGSLPGGPRADAFIARMNGQILPEHAGLLATYMLSDLADLITAALDSGFSLIRYNPGAGAQDFNDFNKLENDTKSYVMENFYRPFLEEEWERLPSGAELLLGITIPFPGCFVPALVCADSAKKRFGKKVITAAGGGFVNTELRFIGGEADSKADKFGFFKYFDRLSLDRGYADLVSVLENREIDIEAAKSINDEAVKTIFPDYTGLDFSRYLYPVDDANPMHRLWSDGHWLKAYLAHGCYWHSCGFCDISLDYIKNFIPVDPKALFDHLVCQANKTGCRGVHFVDESAPPASLIKFALHNRSAGLPLVFWGNVRPEKTFSFDAAAVLAAGGLVGVSAGFETVTDAGLRSINKGVTVRDLVYFCAALKEAGILVHAYLIFGYWDQSEEDIIDSAEIIRQFFFHGLLDSAFWHKFTLTCHSRLYAEKQNGLHPGLSVNAAPVNSFCLNDLSFKGEQKFEKYSLPLERLLASWMDGYGLQPQDSHLMQEAFPFKIKPPSVGPDYVLSILDQYGRDRNMERNHVPDTITGESKTNSAKTGGVSADGARVIFLGSAPNSADGKILQWRWRLKECRFAVKNNKEAADFSNLLAAADSPIAAAEFYRGLEKILGCDSAKKTWGLLRNNGLSLLA